MGSCDEQVQITHKRDTEGKNWHLHPQTKHSQEQLNLCQFENFPLQWGFSSRGCWKLRHQVAQAKWNKRRGTLILEIHI